MRLIHQPHDKLFKQAMADLRVAREFFEIHVPANIRSQIDLNTLHLEKDSFIDAAYKNTEADLVYSVSMGNHIGYFYLLCENQSGIDQNMAFRLLVYTVRLMELHLKKQGKKSPLPIVYPLVIYSGKQQWDAPLEIFDLFGEQAELARQTLLKPYQLIDLQRITDNELCKHRWSGLVQIALKYRQLRDFRQFLDITFPWMQYLASHDGANYALTVLRYALRDMKDGDAQLVIEKSNEYLSGTLLQGEIMTVAEQFREEGRAEGEAALLIRQLTTKFGELSSSKLAKIQQANPELLMQWGVRILSAKTLQDILY